MTGTTIGWACVGTTAVAILLSGCSSQPGSPLAAAGSMRVEVEVYKGPLSEPLGVQMGELTGVLKEARAALALYGASTNPACPPDEPVNCDRQAAIQSAGQLAGLMDKLDDTLKEGDIVITKLFGLTDANDVQLIGYDSGPKYKAQIRRFAAEAAEIGAQLKARAFFTAYRELGNSPRAKADRRDLTHFTTIAAEYGNQITSRATSLLLQLDEGTRREDLALSQYLKDAAHTDFLRLYDWFDATGGDQPAGDGLKNLSGGDRVQLAQRLFADHNWSKVNQVHANGQGEVRMAFIRDQLGNWNLKSFDNNPEELLTAYRNMTEAGIQLAIRAAQSAASGGGAGALPIALDAAGQLIRGQVGGETLTTNTAQIDALRRRVVADLERIKVAAGETETALQAARGKLGPAETKLASAKQANAKDQQDLAAKRADSAADPAAIAALEQKEQTSAAAVVAAQSDVDAASAAVKAQGAMMAKLVADARTALDTHRRVIEALQAQYVAADAG